MLSITQNNVVVFDWLSGGQEVDVYFDWDTSGEYIHPVAMFQLTITGLPSSVTHSPFTTLDGEPIGLLMSASKSFKTTFSFTPPQTTDLNNELDFNVVASLFQSVPNFTIDDISTSGTLKFQRMEWQTFFTNNPDGNPQITVFKNATTAIPMTIKEVAGVSGIVEWSFLNTDIIDDEETIVTLPTGVTGSFSNAEGEDNYSYLTANETDTNFIPSLTVAGGNIGVTNFKTALKGVNKALSDSQYSTNFQREFFIFDVVIQESASVDISPSSGVAKENVDVFFTVTYTCLQDQGSNSAFDLTLSHLNIPSNTATISSVAFLDSNNANTITTIPFYGTTTFNVKYTIGQNPVYGFYSGLKVKLFNSSQSIDIESRSFSLEIVNGATLSAYFGEIANESMLYEMEVIAGQETSLDLLISSHFLEDEAYTLNVPDFSSDTLIDITTSPLFEFDSNSLTETETLKFLVDAKHSSVSNVEYEIELKNGEGVVVDTATLQITIIGAEFNVSLPSDEFELAQGVTTTLNASVFLESNGVVFNNEVGLIKSNIPNGVEVSMENFTPTVSGTIVPIKFNVDSTASLVRKVPITLTFQTFDINGQSINSIVSQSVTIFISINFSSVSDFNNNSITETNGIVRLHVGNNGNIKGSTSKPTWIGYIDRTYFNKIHKPDASFYFYPSWLDTFSSPSEFSVNVNQTGIVGNFADETHYYKIAQVYDGNQRSMLGSILEADYEGDVSDADASNHVYKYGLFTIKIPLVDFNNRITEYEIYRSDKAEGEYSRILNIPLADSIITDKQKKNVVSNSTSFTGVVKKNNKLYTDLGAGYSDESWNPNSGVTDPFYNSSHWRITDISGDHVYSSFQDRTKNWDYYQKFTIQSDGTIEIEYKEDNFLQGTNSNPTTSATTPTENLFGTSVRIINYVRKQNSLFAPFKWAKKGSPSVSTFCKMYSGRNLIYCTSDTGTENSLVGKYIKHGNQVRQITANDGKFIQVNEDWDGTDNISATFSILKNEADIRYSKITESGIDKIQILFNDMKFSSVGSDPNKDYYSINVNGKYAFLLNGRLFQGNVMLDPSGAKELNPYWVSYSELDQIDVNPVSNILNFLDKEGGDITGLSSLFNRLVVMKNRSLFMVNCPSNVLPENWSISESIHNIGSIADQGYINQGDVLYVVFYDGIYKLSANNLSDVDKTPTERLKITGNIQDKFDEIENKEDILSIYDMYNDEILFKWHRNAKNLVKNSDYASGTSNWTLNTDAGASITDEVKISGSRSVEIIAEGESANSGTSIISDYIKVDTSKNYTASAYSRCPELTNERFYVMFNCYDNSKARIGTNYNLKIYYSASDNWERHSKTILSSDFPIGTKYIRLRAFWYAPNLPPIGKAYVDQWQLEVGTVATEYECYEVSQEIFAYNIDSLSWREIYTTGSIGYFTYDNDNSVLYWDNRDHKIKSFTIKEAVEASVKTNPITLTEDRYEMLRRISTKVKTSDNLTINIIGDGDETNKETLQVSPQSRPTLEKNKLRKKCKDVQIEIISPATKNDTELHKIELEYT
jgi:hypothetical protein